MASAFSGKPSVRFARLFINHSANAPRDASPACRKTRREFERDSVMGAFRFAAISVLNRCVLDCNKTPEAEQAYLLCLRQG